MTEKKQPQGDGVPSVQSPPEQSESPRYGGQAYYGNYGGAAYYGGSVVQPGILGEINPKRLLRVARKKWITISVVVLFALISAAIYLLVATKEYEATCLIELSVRRPRIAGQQAAVIEDVHGENQSEEIFNTRLEKLKGRRLQDMALAKAKKEITHPEWSEFKRRKWIFDHVYFALVRRSRILEISFVDPNPQVAADMANAFGEASEDMAFEENKIASDSAVAWLEAQASVQRKALEKADQELVDFRAENKLDVLESQKKTAEESLVDFNKALTDIESQKVLVLDLYNTLVSLELKPENAGQLPDSIPRSEEIRETLDKWLTAASERDELLTRYTDQHPEVLAKNKVVDVLRKQALEAIRRAEQTTSANLDLLKKQETSLRDRIKEQGNIVSDLEIKIIEKTSRLSTLERSRDAADISYKGILNRIEESRLSADETTAMVKIAERAMAPEKPIRPRKVQVLALALLLGVVGGFVLGLLTEVQENYVSNISEIEESFGMSVLGVVPRVPGIHRKVLAKATLSDPLGVVAEAVAGVRSMIDSLQGQEGSHSVLIVSTAPKEGKTSLASNLAIGFAKSGARTLLIDFDMRRPQIGTIFEAASEVPSLIHALSAVELTDFSTLPIRTLCENLDIVVSRPAEKLSSAEILGSRTVRGFMDWARKNYERIIVDSPPYGVVSDALALARLVDGVLLVCRPNSSRKSALHHAIKHLQTINANILGVVVNGVDSNDAYFLNDRYYGYMHYSGLPSNDPVHPSQDQRQSGAPATGAS